MSKKNFTLTSDRLREVLLYDPESGSFTWKKRVGRAAAGSVAGSARKSGYVSLGIDKNQCLAHRLAFLYMTGEWPSGEIDHIDRNPGNNRWSNLREVSSLHNKQNVLKPKSNKKYSELIGAQWCKQRQLWKSSIRYGGKLHHLGVYMSDIGASEAYMRAKILYQPGYVPSCLT